MNYKKRLTITIAMLFGCLACLMSAVVIVDPFFHYHGPIPGISYDMENERYINDGIVKHFEYDALILGTSMTENIKASSVDMLFGVHSVKTPLAGATYREIGDLERTALRSHPDIKLVIRGLDYPGMNKKAEELAYTDYPEYLYNGIGFDDIRYLLNKNVYHEFATMLRRKLRGLPMTDFDEYSNWNDDFSYGAKVVYSTLSPSDKNEETYLLTPDEERVIRENIRRNVTDLAGEYPDTEFIIYFTPPSVCYFEQAIDRRGRTKWQVAMEQVVLEELLSYDNIRVFSFSDRQDIVCDLNRYCDYMHHDGRTSDEIVEMIARGEGEITKENYAEYLKRMYTFLTEYDFDALRSEY